MGDSVNNGILTTALNAHEMVFFETDLGLAEGAGKDLEEFFVDQRSPPTVDRSEAHVWPPVGASRHLGC